MARKMVNEFTAGIFVLVCLAAMVATAIWIGGEEVLAKSSRKAVFFVKAAHGATGLANGSPVRINDLQIGVIQFVSYDAPRNGTFYHANIDSPDFVIHSDAQASIVAVPLAPPFLSISSMGSPDKPEASIDNPVEISGGLAALMVELQESVKNIRSVTETLKIEFQEKTDGTVLSKVKSIMNGLDTAVAKVNKISIDIGDIVTDAKPKVGKTLTAVQDTIETLEKYSKSDLADMFAKLREANTEILRIAKNLGDVSEQARKIIVLNSDNIDEIINNMTQVSSELKGAAKEIRRNPWRLLYQPTNKEVAAADLYDATRAFAGGAEQLDAAIARLKNLYLANPQGIPADDPTLKKVRQELEEAFKKFKKVEDALWKQAQK